ncbi:MAG: hypothetical protein L0154_16805 [Chloroflexi bacterium]|nr:hypothetical protein [Chloroflexota bacterium]
MSEQTGLRILFELEMQYRVDQPAITSPEGKVGEYIGSGDGTVTGKIDGLLRWDLYEAIDDDVCLTNLAGEIEVADGSIIRFDARGHGKVTRANQPHLWTMVYGVKFSTDSQIHDWLNTTLGVWVGQFDMQTYKHKYRVYARSEL